ncbi:MAG: response regulator [Limisphaerales bacterium]
MNPTAILVVEDDHFILKFLKQAVSEFYFGPAYYAKSAEEALALYQVHHEAIAILLTDLTLPGMTGEELAATLVRQNQRLQVVVSTGKPIAAQALTDVIGHPVELLAKPFKPTELKEILERASSNAFPYLPTPDSYCDQKLVAA